jgi:hypothetical protein
MDAIPGTFDKLSLLTPGFADRAPLHDRSASTRQSAGRIALGI